MTGDGSSDAKRPTREQLEAIAAGATMDADVLDYLMNHDGDGAVQQELDQIKSEIGFLDEFVEANQDELKAPAPITEQQEAPEGYEIVRELDRGAQGVVYLGRQLRTKRAVALKMILQSAFATDRQRIRFEREVELVASLKHPGIVTVFDSGVAPDGRLFTAMEYIDGVPLNDYRRIDQAGQRHDLSRRERVELFLRVCDAVIAAHQRGIIHRDLKPLNILVDAEGDPHVLDFGLAKVVGPEAMNESAMYATAAGEFMGTFAYASPEQVSGDPDLVDTRTDVYALGIILFDLLLNERPYELGGNVHEMIKGILEAKPRTPRSIDPDFDRDLETILLMTLAKEPQRRYQSVLDLADDLHRWLNGEPIFARRDDTMYVLGKFMQRHRLGVGLAAGFVLLLIGVAITMSILYANVPLANQRLAGTLGMASNVIASADPENIQRGSTATTAVDMLLAWSDVVQADLGDDPDISSRIYNDLGESFIGFDRYDLAQRHLEQAYFALEERNLGSSLEAARALRNLGRIAYKQGRWETAGDFFQRSLDIRRQQLAAPHPDIAEALQLLGATYRQLGRPEDAERTMRESLDMYDQLMDTATPEQRSQYEAAQGSVLNGLGLLLSRSRPREAIAFYTQSIELLDDETAEEDWRLGRLQHNIGMCHYRLGNLDEAGDYLESSLQIKEAGLRRLKSESTTAQEIDAGNRLQIATGKQALANVHFQMKEYDQAEALATESIGIRADVLEPDHYQLSDSRELLARIKLRTNRAGEAVTMLETIRSDRLARNDSPVKIAWTESNLGQALLDTGRPGEAEGVLLAAWNVLASDEGPGPNSPHARETAMAMIRLYEQTDRPEDAERVRSHIETRDD